MKELHPDHPENKDHSRDELHTQLHRRDEPHTHSPGESHSRTHTHGEPHVHSHGGHTHVHTPEEKKRRLNRIARIIGHLEHTRDMIERDADCTEVLIQLSACRSALNGLAKQIIREHLSGCVVQALETGNHEELDALREAIEKFI